MSRKLEIELEKKICEKVVDCILDAGYFVTVNNGEEDVLEYSLDKYEIMNAVGSTDQDNFILSKEGEVFKYIGFNWGEVEEVIFDYSVELEPIIQPALDFTNSYHH